MFANEQVKEWEAKVQKTIADAQKLAQARARQVEAEARKALELLGDRAQVEVKALFAQAQEGTRDQWAKLGADLVRLGQHLQTMAKTPVSTPASEAAKAAAVDAQGPDAGIH